MNPSGGALQAKAAPLLRSVRFFYASVAQTAFVVRFVSDYVCSFRDDARCARMNPSGGAMQAKAAPLLLVNNAG
jgi:hypothetical protein